MAAHENTRDLYDALTSEAGLMRLIANTLGEHHDAQIGSPVTPEQARDLPTCMLQLDAAIERLEDLAERVQESAKGGER
ncbi:MAG: hypothetical protein ACP5P4_14345 [Steroidobacteraceae bacterium]